MVLKKQQQYAALGSLDPELIMLLIISDLQSISHYITADKDGPLSHSEEPAQFLSLFFFSNTLHEVCAGTKGMIKGRGSIFHFPFLPSVSLNLKIVLDSGTIAWTECKAVGGNSRQMSEIACCAQ